MRKPLIHQLLVALSFVGSAILLFACGAKKGEDTSAADEAIQTEYIEDLSVVMSENGRRSYRFKTPLLEGYSMAREPYREFRKGVDIITYQDDSLSTVKATLTANYAIYYTGKELWEAKGNVVVKNSDGNTLYTQQLFWNAKTKRIYSNVDSKVVREGSKEELFGEGFESDEEFKDWRFRKNKIRMELLLKPTEGADSTQVAPQSTRSPQDANQQSVTRPNVKKQSLSTTAQPSKVEPVQEQRVQSVHPLQHSK